MRSSPPNTARPLVTRAAGCKIPITASAVTDLPQPLSPTMPTVSPFATVNPTLSSARTTPSRVLNSTERSSTLRSGGFIGHQPPSEFSCPSTRVDQISQSVPQEIEAEHREHEG